jgi:hypothetical protein
MNLKDKATEMAEEIATELSNLISKKFEILSEIGDRLKKVENLLESHISNSKIIAVESERMITEKYEELTKRNEETFMNLINEIENLKSEINSLKKEEI